MQQIGRGAQAVRHLARYVHHVALTNQRLETFAHGRVTFRYTHARTQETRRVTLPVDAFITRFLHHVLLRGFTKIRHYGLPSPTARADLERARHLLDLHAVASTAPDRDPAQVAPRGAEQPIVMEPVALPVARLRRSRAPPT